MRPYGACDEGSRLVLSQLWQRGPARPGLLWQLRVQAGGRGEARFRSARGDGPGRGDGPSGGRRTTGAACDGARSACAAGARAGSESRSRPGRRRPLCGRSRACRRRDRSWRAPRIWDRRHRHPRRQGRGASLAHNALCHITPDQAHRLGHGLVVQPHRVPHGRDVARRPEDALALQGQLEHARAAWHREPAQPPRRPHGGRW